MSARLAFALGAIMGGAFTLGFVQPNFGPRLVGFGCLGASGPIYADNESDFPQCLRIERF